MVRFQWYGLYQDKPKVGYFMLRIKVPSGILTAGPVPRHRRAVGQRYGRDYTELSTRQNIQLHWLQIKQFPEVFAAHGRGRPDLARRLRRHACATSPAARSPGSTPTSCSTARPAARARCVELLPRRARLLRSAAQAQDHHLDLPAQCNAPEINCIVFIGTAPGTASTRLASPARRRRAVVDAAHRARPGRVRRARRGPGGCRRRSSTSGGPTCKYRLSRAKARLKFLVDDYGPEGVRDADPGAARPHTRAADEAAAPSRRSRPPRHPRAEAATASYYIGFPVFLGQVTGAADRSRSPIWSHEFGGDIRVARQQNFILTGIPEARASTR